MNTICQQCAARLDPGAQSCDLCGAQTSTTVEVPSSSGAPQLAETHQTDPVFPGAASPAGDGKHLPAPGNVQVEPASVQVPTADPVQLARQPILIASEKNPGLATVLGFLFGPLGLLYASVPAALAMFAVNCVVLVVTFGFGLFLTWPVSAYVGYRAAIKHNERLRQELGVPAAVRAA